MQKFWFKEQQQLEGKGGGHSNARPPPPAATDSKAKGPPSRWPPTRLLRHREYVVRPLDWSLLFATLKPSRPA